jgi:hypothetical protein
LRNSEERSAILNFHKIFHQNKYTKDSFGGMTNYLDNDLGYDLSELKNAPLERVVTTLANEIKIHLSSDAINNSGLSEKATYWAEHINTGNSVIYEIKKINYNLFVIAKQSTTVVGEMRSGKILLRA